MALQADGKIVVGGCSHATSSGDCRVPQWGGDADHFTLARYTSGGALDESFGSGGKVVTVFGDEIGEFAHGIADMAIRPDGKIVAVGTATKCHVRVPPPDPNPCPLGGWNGFALARYDNNGSLDLTFGRGGTVITNPQVHGWGAFYGHAMALQPDGKIIVVGSTFGLSDFVVARYLENGLLDPTFGGDGIVTTEFTPDFDAADAVVVQSDGRIMVGGLTDGRKCTGGVCHRDWDFALARYNTDGTLDDTFGTAGKVTTDLGGFDEIRDLAIHGSGDDGRITAAGRTASDLAIARYRVADGSLDPTFGASGTGTVTTDLGAAETGVGLVLDGLGRTVVVGSSGPDFAIARYGANGSLDASFGSRGWVITDLGGTDGATDVAVQPTDGRLVIVGRTVVGETGDFALARYMP